jgi:hypothetical protein
MHKNSGPRHLFRHPICVGCNALLARSVGQYSTSALIDWSTGFPANEMPTQFASMQMWARDKVHLCCNSIEQGVPIVAFYVNIEVGAARQEYEFRLTS